MSQAKTIPDDDFLVVEDLDLGDESRLRALVSQVESMLSVPGRGLRVSVLTSEQWTTVVSRLLSGRLRSGVERHVHTLRDPRDPQHLLVSPSAVQGINENSRFMYQDVVYAILRCLPTDLPEPLRHGVDDLIAEAVGEEIDVDLFCRNYPAEREIVQALTGILSGQFGHEPSGWAIELRRSPRRVMIALGKSDLLPFWKERVRVELGRTLEASDLVEALLDPELDLENNLPRVSAGAILDFWKKKR